MCGLLARGLLRLEHAALEVLKLFRALDPRAVFRFFLQDVAQRGQLALVGAGVICRIWERRSRRMRRADGEEPIGLEWGRTSGART